MDEVACPYCGEKRILYFGDDPEVVKLMLSGMGKNVSITQKLTELESQVTILRETMSKSLIDAQNVMTSELVNSVKHEIGKHELKYHNVKPPKR